jgi:dimethylamine monooxygenase subunit A
VLPYFPLEKPQYEMSFGIKPLVGPRIEKIGNFDEEVRLKQTLLNSDFSYRCLAPLASAEILAEAASSLLKELPDLQHSESFFEVGRQVPDDLLLLDGDPSSGFRLLAGQLCFPNGWTLSEKIGKPLLAIHDPVPGFAAKLGPPTLKLHEFLKPDRPVWRLNWGIKPTGQLDLSGRAAEFVRQQEALVTAENAGERCWFRVERQSLSRLPETGAILFTIRTYQSPVADLTPEQKRLTLGNLLTAPEQVLAYKGILPFRDPLVTWLERVVR